MVQLLTDMEEAHSECLWGIVAFLTFRRSELAVFHCRPYWHTIKPSNDFLTSCHHGKPFLKRRAFGVALLQRKCLSHRRRICLANGTFAKVLEEHLSSIALLLLLAQSWTPLTQESKISNFPILILRGLRLGRPSILECSTVHREYFISINDFSS